MRSRCRAAARLRSVVALGALGTCVRLAAAQTVTEAVADALLAAGGDVVIGAEYTAIDDGAFAEKGVTSLTFAGGSALTSIGDSAFRAAPR